MNLICSTCRESKPQSMFNLSRKIKRGFSYYCKACNQTKTKAFYLSEIGQAAVKAYHRRPEVIERTDAWKRATPRHSLSVRLNHALKRRPSPDQIGISHLMDLWVAQDGLCVVSGIRMTWKGGTVAPTSISIDRIDSSKGYVPGNVRLICWMVNSFKGKFSDDQMISMAHAIVANARPKLKLVS